MFCSRAIAGESNGSHSRSMTLADTASALVCLVAMLSRSAHSRAPAAEAQRRSQLPFSNGHLAEKSLPAELHLANPLQSRKTWLREARYNAFCVVQTQFATVEKSTSADRFPEIPNWRNSGMRPSLLEPKRSGAMEKQAGGGRRTGSAEPCAQPCQALDQRLRVRNGQGAARCAAGLAFSGMRRLDNGRSGDVARLSRGNSSSSRNRALRMRVLIDGDYRSQARGTGITTYARLLADSLSRNGHAVHWLSGAHARGAPDALADAVHVADDRSEARGPRAYLRTLAAMAGGILKGSVTVRGVSPGIVMPRASDLPASTTLLAPDLFVHAHYRHMLARQFMEIRAGKLVDVLHLTAPLPVQIRDVRTIVTIHDLVPIRLPYTTQDNKREFIDRVRMSMKLADVVVTVSEASRRDIVELLGADPAKVVVTWQTSDIAPLTAAERLTVSGALSRYGLQEDGYALFVGAIEPKKNLRRLIEAFFDADSTMPLALVGPKAWKWRQEVGEVHDSMGAEARSRLRILGHVASEDLRRLYAGARMLVFPSLYEGFGLPVLEAMRMGCPVLASGAGGLSEVCGEAALITDPLDRADMTQKIARLLGDRILRDELRAAGLVQALRFSPEAYDQRLREAYGLIS